MSPSTGSSAGTHVGWTRSRRGRAGTATRYPASLRAGERGTGTQSTPMNPTLRGPALVDDTVLPDVLVHVEGERITAVTPIAPGTEPPPGADAAERVSGTMVPAYVDVHCHGGGGTAFTDLRDDAAAAAAAHHHARGSTSLLASLVTMSQRD